MNITTYRKLRQCARGLTVTLCLTVLSLISQPAMAQTNCVIKETVLKLGNCNSDNYRYKDMSSTMSKVTGIRLIQNRGNCSCSNNEHFIYQERFAVAYGSCRGDFEVTGIAKNCTPNQSNSDIAQVPLFLTRQSEPNVMFLLDDSGSMQFDVMPDGLIIGDARYIYPRVNDVYGGSDYTNIVPTTESNNIYNRVTRSPQSNSVYYNPGITYNPWTKYDATLYANANPSCAPHNPEITGKGCRDLKSNNKESAYWVGCTSSTNCYYESSADYFEKTFWPAVYYWHKGGDKWTSSNYDEVKIASSTTTYSGHGRVNREDCADAANGNCTYAEEIQNFANWYTYYRSRILASRAGIGAAFALQGPGMRVGFGTINQGSNNVDGVDTEVIDDGVRVFNNTAKEAFFDNLYKRNLAANGTPLRNALDKAGQYFSRSDNRGPWGAEPGTNNSSPHASCRRSYTVLMTDGYWSGGSSNAASTSDAQKNNDGTDGSTITGINNLSYKYQAKSPFTDSRDNTLADIAMYYWKRDLRTNVDNNVSPLDKNPAFWQHMTTYGVGLGVEGSVKPDDAFAAIKSGASITWPNPDTGTTTCSGNQCPARIDDLLHASVNSRGGFFSASNPNVFASELASVLQTIAVETQSSASSIATNSTRLDTGTLVYQARFDTRDWSSQVVAFDLNPDGSLKSEVWNTDTAGKIPAHGSRNIFTAVGTPGTRTTSGTNFTTGNWGNLTTAQQDYLKNGGSENDGKAILNWLRGDQSNESANGLRERNKILGDIVNSDPFFVGSSENFGYSSLPGTEGTSYSAYLAAKAANGGRRAMLYVGGNDGMLHAFDASTGKEIFGFVPLNIYQDLADLADPDYDHRYYVDGSPAAGDVYLSNTWKTVLVGSTGAGGRSVFALDVTDPESMGSGKFMWEFSTNSASTHKLGVAMSNPVIARVKAGSKWVAIFGNGYNAGDNVKLLVVDLADGSLIRAIDTGVAGTDNGLASVVPVDTDRDRITDYIYAGDLKGNLWKFDLTATTATSWAVANTSGGSPAPLFVAKDDNGNRQPITARPAVGNHETSGLMIYFGTGKYFETGDATVPNNPQIQDFYGIRDQGNIVDRADLVTQSIIYESIGTLQNDVGDDSDNTSTDKRVRVVSNNSAGTPVAKGWRLQLKSPGTTNGSGERATSRPILRDGRIIFTSNIPDGDPCGFGGNGWLMELDANNGGRLSYSVFDVNDDTLFTEGDYVKVGNAWLPVSGIGHEEMLKTPGIVSAGDKEYKYTSGTSGTIGVTREKSTEGNLGRQSWRQLK